MIRWIIKLLLNGAVLLLISQWFEAITISGFGVAVWAAFILGLVNTFIRPILLFFSLPLRVMTLGLFWFVINALTFALTAYLINGFEVGEWPGSFGTVLMAAAVMSLCGWIIESIISKKKG